MKKYAMIPINSKENDEGQPVIRRVLVSYSHTVQKDGQVFYKKTKLIDVDPYFKQERSHKYTFKNENYILERVSNINSIFGSGIVGVPRQYHYVISKDPLKPPAIEFEAISDENARVIFHNRNELRD